MKAKDRTKYADYGFLAFLTIAGVLYSLSGALPGYKDVLSGIVGAMILAAIASFAILTVAPLAISAFRRDVETGIGKLETYSYLVLLGIAALAIIAELLDAYIVMYLGSIIVGVAYILAYAKETRRVEG